MEEKTWSYLIKDGSEDKKAKGTKKCVIKRKPKFENCKNCLKATQPDNEIKYLEKKGKGEAIPLTPLYSFHLLYRHLDINRVVTAESSPLHTANTQTQTRNLWFLSAIH